MKTIRLDQWMVENKLVESRSIAQRLVMEGKVRVNGQVALKPSQGVRAEEQVSLEAEPRFVSRGGEKLEGAFSAFGLETAGLVCADVGASTGGFTDCLLQHGAGKVYAVDVGYGILHWKLRNDARVINMERQNARYIDRLPEPVSFITIDASFISLDKLLPGLRGWFGVEGGRMIALIKPQFEAGRKEVSRGDGVITDPVIHARVARDTLELAQVLGYGVLGLELSPIKGPKGNIEFLAYLEYPGQPNADIAGMIKKVLPEANESGSIDQ